MIILTNLTIVYRSRNFFAILCSVDHWSEEMCFESFIKVWAMTQLNDEVLRCLKQYFVYFLILMKNCAQVCCERHGWDSILSTGAWECVRVSSCCQTGYWHCQLWQGFHSAGVWGQHQVSVLCTCFVHFYFLSTICWRANVATQRCTAQRS